MRELLSRRASSVAGFVLVALLGPSTAPSSAAATSSSGSGFHNPRVVPVARHGVSPELRSAPRLDARGPAIEVTREREEENDPRSIVRDARRPLVPDPVVQTQMPDRTGRLSSALTLHKDISGIPNLFGVLPPDTQGDVGRDHYVQWVNLGFAVWDKSGAFVAGAFFGNALWTGFGGACEDNNDGDPITLYDHLADRWMMSQFALGAPDGNHQCIAVSVTGDPLGSYYLYDFNWGPLINDYPKFGVWPDGYYMTVNQFTATSYAGAGVAVFERERMLSGQPARMITFGRGGELSAYYSIQPAHLEGPPPPTGAPNPFVQLLSLHLGDGIDGLQFWNFHTDWSDPAASSFTPSGVVPTSSFDSVVCVTGSGTSLDRNCVPQQGTTRGLDAIPGRTMYRSQYRNFGGHESIVVTTTVDVDPATIGDAPGSKGRAAQRWYEVRNPIGAPSLHQEGSFAPDTLHRWMGSIAMDGNGNIALGYSTSSASDFPSIQVTGRHAGDPLGTMTEPELPIHLGAGSQTSSSSRWGDYSTMSVDPVDDCTFWFTNEYLDSTSSASWKTRIGVLSFGDCVPADMGALEGTVTTQLGGTPIEGAIVHAGAYSTTTASDGTYSFPYLPAGSYDMSVDAYGFTSANVAGVAVVGAGTTVQNFQLQALAMLNVVGYVTDADAGWPLYARIEITAPGGFSDVAYTNPATGEYLVTLAQGTVHDFHVVALSGTYEEADRKVTAPAFENFALGADLAACDGPGLIPHVDAQDMNAGVLPPGWTLHNNAAPNASDWRFDNPFGWGNYTGGSGGFAIADSLYDYIFGGATAPMDTELRTPNVDVSGTSHVQLKFASALFFYYPGVVADVDAKVNGGSWNNIWQHTSADGDLTGEVTVEIPSAVNQSTVRLRWHYYNAFFDYFWQVDDVRLETCTKSGSNAGLLVGNVYDLNTGQPINGATVSDDLANQATTTATPGDPSIDDGFYTLTTQAVTRTVTADATHYGPSVANVNVAPGGVTSRNFFLAAGLLDGGPLVIHMGTDQVQGASIPLANLGNYGLTFDPQERNYPIPGLLAPVPAGSEPQKATSVTVPTPPVAARATSVIEARARMDARLEKMRSKLTPQQELALERRRQAREQLRQEGGNAPEGASESAVSASGNRTRASTRGPNPSLGTSFLTGLAAPYGIAYAPGADKLWIGNIAAAGGDDRDYLFLPAGTPTGESLDVSPVVDVFMADFAYNANTNSLWQVTLDKCIYEIDPATVALTGNRICAPGLSTSQRGLAYDPISDTYYSGSFNDGVLHQYAPNGVILRSVAVGINITGLAFNPATGHLYVLESFSGEDWIYILDTAPPSFSLLTVLTLTDGVNTIQSSGAGLDIDCNDNLVATDFAAGRAFSSPSTESGACDVYDIPWLSVTSGGGPIAALSGVSLDLVLDSTGLAPGTYDAHLRLFNDTPYGPKAIPVTLIVDEGLFSDGFESGDVSAWSSAVQ